MGRAGEEQEQEKSWTGRSTRYKKGMQEQGTVREEERTEQGRVRMGQERGLETGGW